MSTTNSNKVFFEGLNELRAYAALAVVVCHIEAFKYKASLPSLYKFEFIKSIGPHGVFLFFVLSGFLITYLLHKEKEKTGTTNIKNFYIRRLLRIWPLYLTVLIAAFVLAPWITPWYFPQNLHENIFSNFALAAVLPNLLVLARDSFFLVGVLWSVAMEEQFYLLFPGFFKKWADNLARCLFLVLLLVFSARICFWLVHKFGPEEFKIKSFILLNMINFEPIIIGCILGTLYYKKHPFIDLLQKRIVEIGTIVLLLVLYYIKPKFVAITEIVYAPLYAIIIINMAANENSLFRFLKSRLFSKLGIYSYSIYMIHSAIVALVLHLIISQFGKDMDTLPQILLYVIGITGSCFCSMLSYEFFESKFLKIKSKFAIVASGTSR